MISGTSAGVETRLSPQQVARHNQLSRGEKLSHLEEIRADLVARQRTGRPLGKVVASPSLKSVEEAIQHVKTH